MYHFTEQRSCLENRLEMQELLNPLLDNLICTADIVPLVPVAEIVAKGEPTAVFRRGEAKDISELLSEALQISEAVGEGDLGEGFVRGGHIQQGMLEAQTGEEAVKIDAHGILKQSGDIGSIILGIVGQIFQGDLLGIVLLNIGHQAADDLLFIVQLRHGSYHLGIEIAAQGGQKHLGGCLGGELGKRGVCGQDLIDLGRIHSDKEVPLLIAGLCGRMTVGEMVSEALFHIPPEGGNGKVDGQPAGIGRPGKSGMAQTGVDQADISSFQPILLRIVAELQASVEQRMEAVRETVGVKTSIIVEAHSHNSATGAVQIANALKKYDVFFYEEPNTPNPITAKYISEHTDVPMASGERIYSRWQYAPYLTDGSLRVIQPDIGTAGGFSETKKICDMAMTYDVFVQPHVCGSPLATTIALQLEAVIPNFIIHEHNSNLRGKAALGITKYNPQPVNGFLDIPDEPGIGNEILPEAYEKARCIAAVTADGCKTQVYE